MSIKKLFKNKGFLFISLIGLFPPAYFDQYYMLNIIFQGIKIVVTVFILFVFLINIRKHLRKISNIFLLILIVELLLSTLISDDGLFYMWITQVVNVLIICVFFEELALYAPFKSLCCLYYYFSFITTINTVTIFLFPNAMYTNNRGLWNCWFLGEDNGAYIFYILAITFALLYWKYISRRMTLVVFWDIVSTFVFVFHNDIATGIVCQVIWLFLFLEYQFKWTKKLLKEQYALYVMLAGTLLLVIGRRLIITSVVTSLGRDISLTGRTLIWDKTIMLILKRPVLGYGICSGDLYAQMIGYNGITMAHDWLLNLAFAGGIVAVVLYVLLIICTCRESSALKETAFYRLLVIGFMVICIRAVTEGSYWPSYFIFPVMLSYGEDFIKGIESNHEAKKHLVKVRTVFGSGKYSERCYSHRYSRFK